jgi:hypothetical protein
MEVDPVGCVGSKSAGSAIMTERRDDDRVCRMTKNKKHEWKSLDGLLRGLKAQAKRIELAKEVLPDDIANDLVAVLQWMREEERFRKRRKKWD